MELIQAIDDEKERCWDCVRFGVVGGFVKRLAGRGKREGVVAVVWTAVAVCGEGASFGRGNSASGVGAGFVSRQAVESGQFDFV